MIYLHVFVEGKTELNFVQRVLHPFLGYDGYLIHPVQIVTKEDHPRGRIHKGGFGKGSGRYERVKKQIDNRTKEFNTRSSIHFFTTMFDLYALPPCFPGYSEVSNKNIVEPYNKVKELEKSLADDINDYRFIPYIQLHEFEALIFVDPGQLIHQYPDKVKEIESLETVLSEKNFKDNPELINEGPTTAPSKRIIQCLPSYIKSKPIVGVNTVGKIGIDAIRKKCPHFDEWLKKLEQLKQQ